VRSSIIRLLLWALGKLGHKVLVPIDPFSILLQRYRAIARKLVKLAPQKVPHADGHGKRHWVYIRMCRAFPEARHRDLNLSIELSVRDHKRKKDAS